MCPTPGDLCVNCYLFLEILYQLLSLSSFTTWTSSNRLSSNSNIVLLFFLPYSYSWSHPLFFFFFYYLLLISILVCIKIAYLCICPPFQTVVLLSEGTIFFEDFMCKNHSSHSDVFAEFSVGTLSLGINKHWPLISEGDCVEYKAPILCRGWPDTILLATVERDSLFGNENCLQTGLIWGKTPNCQEKFYFDT